MDTNFPSSVSFHGANLHDDDFQQMESWLEESMQGTRTSQNSGLALDRFRCTDFGDRIANTCQATLKNTRGKVIVVSQIIHFTYM